MQAPPQSSPAARIPLPSTLSRPSSQSGSRTASGAGPVARATRPPPRPIAQGSALAHDAGNLLGALRLYCDLLDRPGVLQARHRHYAVELRRLSDRSSSLMARLQAQFDPVLSAVPNLVAAPHPSETGAGLQLTLPRLAAALRDLGPLLNSLAAPSAVVTVDVPARWPNLPLLDAQLTPDTLERIVVNLVCNAAQAIADSAFQSGLIRVVLHVAANRLQLRVEDDGPGLSRALVAGFLHPAPPLSGACHGLGLHIVYDLAQATGGRLAIRRRPGGGTVFSLEWHLAKFSLPSARTPSRNPKMVQTC